MNVPENSKYAEHFDRADQRLGEALREIQGVPFDAPSWIRAEAEIQAQQIKDQRDQAREAARKLRLPRAVRST